MFYCLTMVLLGYFPCFSRPPFFSAYGQLGTATLFRRLSVSLWTPTRRVVLLCPCPSTRCGGDEDIFSRESYSYRGRCLPLLQRFMIPLSLLLSLVFSLSFLYPSIPFRSLWLEVIHKNKVNGDKCKKKHIPARLIFVC